MDKLPDLRMSALAIMIKTKWNSKVLNKPNDFVVKQALAKFSSLLQDDDVGYFYDPKAPNDLCTNPGELVGKISNSKLPYNFNFNNAIKQFALIINLIDKNDYNRFGLIISDCLTNKEACVLMEETSMFKDININVFGIDRCSVVDGMIYLEDASDLFDNLGKILIG